MIDPALLATERIRPLRRSEYDRLVQLGCFQDEKIELLIHPESFPDLKISIAEVLPKIA